MAFYVIFSCPRSPGIVGIHHGSWAQLASRLPGGRLFGSGAIDCKRFESLDGAERHWFTRRREAYTLHRH